MQHQYNYEDSNNSMVIEEGDQYETGAPADFNFKVIVVGNKNVGKTSITNRCVFDKFDELT